MKKIRFCAIKKKHILIVLCLLLAVASVGVFFGVRAVVAKPNLAPTIVIDAGHGGRDGGAVGDNSTESQLNLDYALTLKDVCEQFGYNVVLTRDDMAGLYSPLASNKKRSEMEKRIEIIEKTNPDMVISIHMNSFPSDTVRGSQVFYAQGMDSGQALAERVQTSLHKNIEYAKKTAKIGDYYILNCSPNPSILIECGFISNPDEEKLLLDSEYRQKFCYFVVCGIISYFEL